MGSPLHIRQVVALVTRVLKPHAYLRKRKNWYGLGTGVMPIVFVEHSLWRRKLDLSVGFWIHALADVDLGVTIVDPLFPEGFQCPISSGTAHLDKVCRDAVVRALDFEPEGEFRSGAADIIERHLNEVVLPHALAGSTLPGLAELLRSGRLDHGLVTRKARTLLESP